MSDPKDPETKKIGDEPLFGSPAPPTDPSPSSTTPSPSTGNGSDPAVSSISAEPLFGATPPSDIPSSESEARNRIEQGSRERVESLRRLRHAETGQSSSTVYEPQQSPPPFKRLTQAPTPSSTRSSTLIPYIRRLSYTLSILLGAGASISLIWSIFLLPRLHASFSARRALVDQQIDRVGGFLDRLREIRGMGVHAGYIRTVEAGGKEEEEIKRIENGNKEKGGGGEESQAMIREISTSSTHSSTPQTQESEPLLPDLTTLIDGLKSLSSTRSNTSTTRTSLLSTIESYTSALHRQLWNPRPGAGFGGGGGGTGYGLSTMDQSLRNEGGSATGKSGVYKDGWESEGLGDRSEEWDKVRKEVRGIKGMLLGRRNIGLSY